MLSKGRFIVVLLLFVATWFVLQGSSGVTMVEIKKKLSAIPTNIGDFRLAETFQSSADVLELLGVDDYIQYNYLNESQERINLYAGYYQAVGVTGSYHSPKNCLPGGGWGIDSIEEVTLNSGIEGEIESNVTQMIIRSGDNYQVVIYWYQNRGRIIASEYWEKVYLVFDAIVQGRRDGTFVRIMTHSGSKEVEKAIERAQHFAEDAMVLLEEHLPGREL